MRTHKWMLAIVCLQAICIADDKVVPIAPANDAPQPLTPEESASKIRLPNRFAIELIASEPLIQDPSCIAFDEKGRLFVCELHGYNIEGHLDVTELNKTGELDMKVRRLRWEFMDGEIAKKAAKLQHGVVKMLTDTNHDGLMDRSEVWATGLPPCYGVVAARGGIIVVCAPDIVFLADRDGDGKPEIRKTLFTGFQTQTIERGINNPRWGVDNWIYVGAGGDGGTITGPNLKEPVELRHSDFRIKPDGSAIEPVNGRVGTFGMTINDVGDRFPSTGGRPAMYALPLPYRYLSRNPYVATPGTNHSAATYNRGFRISEPHPWRVKRQKDPAWVKFYGPTETNSNYFSGGCSNEYYGDVLFPSDFRGNIFYCEPSLNMIHRCVVTRDGPGYKGRRANTEQQSEFLASTDQWFRPMNLRVGPDGALYIVDMYREIIEDYSAIPRFLQQQYGLKKGSDRGRIWRLAPKSSGRTPIQGIAKLDSSELSKLLSSSNAWTRLTAQRLVIERNLEDAVEDLSGGIHHPTSAEHAIHALHTLHGLGKLTPTDVARSLGHKDFGVRIHALRLAEDWINKNGELLQTVTEMIDDPDPSVRLQVALTLGETKRPEADQSLSMLAHRHGAERWMSAAILSSSVDRAGKMLIDLLSQDFNQDSINIVKPLATTVAGRRDTHSMSKALTIVASLQTTIRHDCMKGFIDGLQRLGSDKLEAADGWVSVSRLLKNESQTTRDLAAKLAQNLKLDDDTELQSIFADALSTSTSENKSEQQRLRAIRILANASFNTLSKAATSLLDSSQSPSLQLAAIESLASSTDQRVGQILLINWPRATPQIRAAVLDRMFARSNRLPALLDAIEKGVVEKTAITTLRVEQLTSNTKPEIAKRATALFQNRAADRELQDRIDRYQKVLASDPSLESRDLERGKKLFKKACIGCHKLGVEGFDVGPPLGSIVNKPDETILVDLLDPSGRIEPEYRNYLIVTKDGRTTTGVLASESATNITLRKEKGETESILRKDIELLKASSLSLMPSNLHEQVDPHEAADLLAFLRVSFGRPKDK